MTKRIWAIVITATILIVLGIFFSVIKENISEYDQVPKGNSKPLKHESNMLKAKYFLLINFFIVTPLFI